MKRRRWSAMLLGVAILLPIYACSDSTTVPEDAPDGHTVMEDGVAHATGLNNPLANCATCHGADLRGGNDGQPSCFSCHGQEW